MFHQQVITRPDSKASIRKESWWLWVSFLKSMEEGSLATNFKELETQPDTESAHPNKHPTSRKFAVIGIIFIAVPAGGFFYYAESIARTDIFAFDSVHVNSPTDESVAIRNVGSVPITLTSYAVTYYLNSAYRPQYANSSWAGPTLNPGDIVTAKIVIDGKIFTLQTGGRYSITITVSTGHQDTIIFTA